ncbi:MAG: hypothetical protein R6U58_08270 [Bacteroidales bacterium]
MMEPLPKQLRKNGYGYTQVKRGRRACLYEQSIKGKIVGYEVFLPHISPARQVFGKFYPEREAYPADEDFGYTAWAFTRWNNALTCYNQLERPQNI